MPAELTFADAFGQSLAVSGETAIVGVLVKQATMPPLHGAAYFFERSGRTWSQSGARRTVAVPSDFGAAVAISGDTALIGADATNVGTTTQQGIVHVYQRSGADWTEQTPSIVAADGATGDIFGNAVALLGDTAVVGAPGKPITGNVQGGVYVFVRSNGGWTQQGPMLVGTGRLDFDGFGRSVALSRNTLLVGAGAPGGVEEGRAFVFVRDGETWTQQGDALAAANPASTPNFGAEIALSGDSAVFGVPFMDVESHSHQGAVFVFTRSGNTWTQQGDALVANDGEADDNFGTAVAISGDVILVGAYNHTVAGNAQQGAAYVFRRTGSTWSQDSKVLLASDGGATGKFGAVIAMSEQTALIGGSAADKRSAIYPFFLGHEGGDACSAAKDCLNLTCVDQVCCDSACASNCDVCSTALGASANGVCSTLPAGSTGSPACGELACTGQSACTPCARDSDCTTGHFCAQNGTCQPQLPDGAACDDPSTLCADASCTPCASGHCSDGVCCDTACDSTCSSCLARLNGTGADGVCAFVSVATDPDDDCARDPNYPSSCGLDGACDGAGACQLALAGTTCRKLSCEAGTEVSGACDGSGTCVSALGDACGAVDPEDPGESQASGSDGCGCRIHQGEASAHGGGMLVLLVLGLACRRRTRVLRADPLLHASRISERP